MNLKDSHVLYVFGHREKLEDFEHEHNYERIIKDKYILEEETNIFEMGYNIEIHKIHEDCVELIIFAIGHIFLKPNERYYILERDAEKAIPIMYKKTLYVELVEK